MPLASGGCAEETEPGPGICPAARVAPYHADERASCHIGHFVTKDYNCMEAKPLASIRQVLTLKRD